MVTTSRTEQPADRSEDAEPGLAVRDLTKTFGGGVTAVDGISFEVGKGSVVGLLGPNGAGKTTTIKMILGTLVPDAGTVTVHGRSVHDDLEWAHENVGVMFEGSRDAYWRLTVRENLEFFTRLQGVPARRRRDRHDELLERLDLAEKADVPVRKLSRGQKQKVAVARALSQDVRVALLDEPTLGLDVETSLTLQDELRSLVHDEDLTVILTSHDMGVIENICDEVVVLSDGQVIAQESVANLVDVFQNDAYRVRLDAPVPGGTEAELRSRFEVADHDQFGDVHEFEVTLVDGDVHDLSDVLRNLECSVRSFETTTPDFEEIFLHITREEGVAYDA